MSHGRVVCRCGALLAQCRCMEGHANVTVAPGPCRCAKPVEPAQTRDDETVLSSDLSLLGREARGHVAFAAFAEAMHGRAYGQEALSTAWSWFKHGFDAGRKAAFKECAFEAKLEFQKCDPSAESAVRRIQDAIAARAKGGTK